MRTWLGTRSSLVVGALLLATGYAVLFSRTTWSADLDWALNWALGTTILLSPATAGLTAWSIDRNYRRSFQTLTQPFVRGAAVPVHLTLHVWVCAVGAWLLTVLTAGLIAASTGDPRVTLNALTLLNGPIVLAASGAIGGLIGVLFRSIAAAPIAAGLVYVVGLASSRALIPRLLWDGAATGTLAGIEPNLPVAVGTFIANCAVAGAALCAVRVVTSRSVRARLQWGTAAAALATMTALAVALPAGQFYYRAAPLAESCVDGDPTVCTAASSPLDARAAAAQLAHAHEVLALHGLTDLPERQTSLINSSIGALTTWIGNVLNDPDAPELDVAESADLQAWGPAALTALRSCDWSSLEEPPRSEPS